MRVTNRSTPLQSLMLISPPARSSNPNRRPLAYTIEKLESLLKWRVESGATTLSELMDVATKTKAESG